MPLCSFFLYQIYRNDKEVILKLVGVLQDQRWLRYHVRLMWTDGMWNGPVTGSGVPQGTGQSSTKECPCPVITNISRQLTWSTRKVKASRRKAYMQAVVVNARFFSETKLNKPHKTLGKNAVFVMKQNRSGNLHWTPFTTPTRTSFNSSTQET